MENAPREEVLNIKGQRSAGAHTEAISIAEEFPSGHYLLRIQAEERFVMLKVVVAR